MGEGLGGVAGTRDVGDVASIASASLHIGCTQHDEGLLTCTIPFSSHLALSLSLSLNEPGVMRIPRDYLGGRVKFHDRDKCDGSKAKTEALE